MNPVPVFIRIKEYVLRKDTINSVVYCDDGTIEISTIEDTYYVEMTRSEFDSFADTLCTPVGIL